MTSLGFEILRNVLSNRTNFCCLCFISIEELNNFVDIGDQVFFEKSTEDMYEILSTVLGDHVLDNIPTNIICLQCSEIAINCYKFIQKCRGNIQHLVCSITSIQKHMKHLKKDFNNIQTLFLTFHSSDYNVESYYDKTKTCNEPIVLFKKIETLKKQDKKVNKNVGLKKRNNQRNQYMQFSEILKNDDNLNCYKCKLCQKLCQSTANFKQHYSYVHAPKDFKCLKCPKSFGQKSFLTQHMRHCHCSVVCSQCGKTYTNSHSLKRHEMSHNVKFACNMCGKVYRGKRSLNNHIKMKLCTKVRKSNAEAKFMCDYCHKKYAQKGALSVHISLEHMNGKGVTCEWCSKKFAAVSKLNDHIIKHTKQKNFECEQCEKRFGTKVALLFHTRIHTGEKPYKCEHCEMAFLSMSRCSEHIKRHHTIPSYKCDICHGMYKSSSCLTRHRKRHFDRRSKLYCKYLLNKIDENEQVNFSGQ